MSTSYYIYTEAKINGKWRCIDGYYWFADYGKTKETRHLGTTYTSFSRTYFGSTYDKLCEIGHKVRFSNLSQEIRTEHPSWKFTSVQSFTGEDKVEASYTVVPYQTFMVSVPKSFEHHSILHKDIIADYENDETDDLYPEAPPPTQMSELESQCYQYYEWDSPDGWYKHFKELSKCVKATVSKYSQINFSTNELEVRLVVFSF